MATDDPTSRDPAQLEERRLALEFERLRFERQKMAAELRLRRRDAKVSGGNALAGKAQGGNALAGKAQGGNAWKDIFSNPLTLAIVGGFLTLMTTTITSSINTANTIAAEAAKARQALQAELIKKFVESPSPETVRTNLSFLSDVGLLPDYAARIKTYLADNPNSAPTASSAGLQMSRADAEAIDLVISLEGGYVDLPIEQGGPRKFGIALSALKTQLRREATKEELRDLDEAVARDIYGGLIRWAQFIDTAPLKAIYLGMAVSIGPAEAGRIVQIAAGKLGGRPIPADGVLGPMTAGVIRSVDPDVLRVAIACEWAKYVRSLPDFDRFGAGWLSRIRLYLPANAKDTCPDRPPLSAGNAAP